jgi:NAD(P)-dependent dehydrogenase (short-subunit alcohol dehydrogenase family)
VGARVAVVTGASSGIGLETVRGLAAQGLQVVLVCRDKARGEAAMTEVRRTAPKAELELVLGDLYTMGETRRVAAELKKRFPRVHVLVNNAGLIHGARELTSEGLERTFALNHMAPFVLTYELRELLAASAPARVVTVASNAHMYGTLRLDDLQRERGYTGLGAYGASKLCNILFAREAARRFAGSGVTSNAVHPGGVRTRFGQTGSGGFRVLWALAWPFLISAARGAKTSVYVASAPDVEKVTGAYFVRCKVRAGSAASRDEGLMRGLWEASEKLAGVRWG